MILEAQLMEHNKNSSMTTIHFKEPPTITRDMIAPPPAPKQLTKKQIEEIKAKQAKKSELVKFTKIIKK